MGESTKGIAQFIPQYPDRDMKDINLSQELAKKKEFYDLRLGPTVETIPVDSPVGTPYKHQLLNTHFISPHTAYKSVLVFYDPGLGKTLLGCYIVEQFKNVLVDGNPRQPAIILVPNEGIQKYWIQQIVHKCTKDVYEPDFDEEEEKTERKYTGRTRSLMKKTYIIQTYSKFIKTLPIDTDQIRRQYSNRVIIIDEAHSLRPIQKGSGSKDNKKMAEKENIKRYNRIYNFLHSVENCRTVLLTATPIWDQTFEIASLMNLILPKEDKLPTKKKFMTEYFTEDGKLKTGKTLDKLKMLFRGRISYLRIKLPVKVAEIGTTAPWLNYIKVYPNAMSEEQADASKKARANVQIREKVIKKDGKAVRFRYNWSEREFVKDKEGNLIPDPSGRSFSIPYKIEGGTLIRKARQACILVAPVLNKRNEVTNVTYDEKYFDEYFKETKQRYSFGNTSKDKALKKIFQFSLYKYSTKYTSIINLLKENPTELAFIYNRFVKEIGGILPFAMILQLHGFVWVTSPNEMKHANKNVRRFIVITSQTETSKDTTANLIDAFNHKDNKYGDLCQIIIGSQKMAVGLTLNCIRQIHFVSPWWNIPSLIQAFGRGYRLGSHDELPEGEKYINLYRHVAVDKAEEKEDGYKITESFPPEVDFSSKDTIDIYMYRVSQMKEFSNSEIYRFMKEIAWDCPLAYNRNVLTTDEDFSRQCDYRECAYDCYGVPIFDFREELDKMSDRQLKKVCKEHDIQTRNKGTEELKEEIKKVWKYRIPKDEIERDTYDLYYSSDKVAKLIVKVTKQFRMYFTLSLESLMRFIPVKEEDKELLLQALDHIIDMRILIRDRYGFNNYLQEYNNVYFLSTSIFVASYLEGNYTSDPLVTERTSLGDIVKGIHFEKDEVIVNEFCKNPTNQKALLDKMGCHTFIILLETTYALKMAKEKGKTLTPRETEAVAVMEGHMKKLLKLIGDEDKPKEKRDVVHVLYQADITKPKCDISNKALKADGSMRIYDEDLGKWKFLDDRDMEEEYINYIKKEKKETAMDIWEGNSLGILGFMETNKKGESNFVIRRNTIPPGKGRVCGTLPKPDLIKVFFDISYFPNHGNKGDRIKCLKRIRNSPMKGKLEERGIDLTRNKIKGFSDEKLQGIDWLMHSANIRNEMCPLLQKWFQTHTDDNGNSLFKN